MESFEENVKSNHLERILFVLVAQFLVLLV